MIRLHGDAFCPGQTAPSSAFWSGCMTVHGSSVPVEGGYKYRGGRFDHGSMTDRTFRRDGTDYEIVKVADAGGSGAFILRFANAPGSAARNWLLRLGDQSLNMSDARYTGSRHEFKWRPGFGNHFGWSDGDDVMVSFSPGSGAPTDLTATAQAEPGTVELSWTAPTGVTVTGYQYTVCPDVDANCTHHYDNGKRHYHPWKSTGSTSTTVVVTEWHPGQHLQSNVRYSYKVRAMVAGGYGAPSAPADVIAPATWVPEPVGPPTGLSATAGSGQVTLGWTAPEEADGITGWQVRHGVTDTSNGSTAWGEWTDIEGATAETASHTVTGLVNGTYYGFQVRAMAGTVEGAESVTFLVQPLAAAGINPAAGLAAAGSTQTSIDLAWTLPTQPVGAIVTGVEVQQQSNGPWGTVATLDADATSHTVTGLTADTAYTFRIRLVASAAHADSEAVQASTEAAPPEDADGTRSGAVRLDAGAAARSTQFIYYDLDTNAGDRVDYFVFALSERKELGLGVREQTFNVDATLEDAAGNTLSRSAPPPGDATIEWLKTTLDAGTYYVRVEAVEDGSTDYMLRFGLADPPPGESSTPAVTGSMSFTVTEGETAVGTLSATDADTPSENLAWSLAGGADEAKFALSSAGALTLAAAKDYESPDDSGNDGTYNVTARVSDGTNSATADLTVTLRNRNEVPSADAGSDHGHRRRRDGDPERFRLGPRCRGLADLRLESDGGNERHPGIGLVGDGHLRRPLRPAGGRDADLPAARDGRGRPLRGGRDQRDGPGCPLLGRDRQAVMATAGRFQRGVPRPTRTVRGTGPRGSTRTPRRARRCTRPRATRWTRRRAIASTTTSSPPSRRRSWAWACGTKR